MNVTTLETKIGATGERVGPVVSRHRPTLVRLARNLCGSASDGEDLVHDVLMKFLTAFHQTPLPEDRACAAWLTTALRNAFISKLRKDKVRKEEVLDPDQQPEAASPASPEEPVFKTVSDEEFAQARAELSEKRRQVLDLHAAGKSYAEISAELRISETAVGKRLHDAKKDLRKRILKRKAAKGG